MTHKARTTGLFIEELDGEFLIYDSDVHVGHVLTADHAALWHRLNGERRMDQLATELDLPAEELQRLIADLRELNLLDSTHTSRSGQTRREFAQRAGAVAIATAGIYSLPIPDASAQGSPMACATVSCSGTSDQNANKAKAIADEACKVDSRCGTTGHCVGTATTSGSGTSTTYTFSGTCTRTQ